MDCGTYAQINTLNDHVAPQELALCTVSHVLRSTSEQREGNGGESGKLVAQDNPRRRDSERNLYLARQAAQAPGMSWSLRLWKFSLVPENSGGLLDGPRDKLTSPYNMRRVSDTRPSSLTAPDCPHVYPFVLHPRTPPAPAPWLLSIGRRNLRQSPTAGGRASPGPARVGAQERPGDLARKYHHGMTGQYVRSNMISPRCRQ